MSGGVPDFPPKSTRLYQLPEDARRQALQVGPIERPARNPAVIIVILDQNPALGLLAEDVGFARLALGIQRIKRHIEPFFGGFPGVNRTTLACRKL